MQRRNFIKMAGLTLAGAGFSQGTPAATGERILVVGAGIAGLAAARSLQQKGYDVQVLEARNRLGGRIWTSSQWTDAPMDLGASWIHGVTGNPITRLAQTIRARTAATSYDSALTWNTNGKLLTASQEARLETLQDKVESILSRAQDQDPDQSVRSVVQAGLGWDSLSAADKRWVNFILNGTLEQEYAGSTEKLSTHWFDDGDEFDGGDVLFLDGYQGIIQYLAQGIPVALGEQVTAVQLESNQVVVQTNNSTWQADRVVITLPLGVLKAGAVKFTPELPTAKQRAIAALGMGVLNKCYLRFPKVFWRSDVDWLEYIPEQRGQWVEWVSFARPTGLPILLGFNAAEQGRSLETLTDAQTVASAMQTLRRMFGNAIPEPTSYQITRWASDPFALGSYSFNALGSTPRMRDQLREPVSNRLYFAGEATHRQHPSSVHGAYLSGVRAAQKISA